MVIQPEEELRQQRYESFKRDYHIALAILFYSIVIAGLFLFASYAFASVCLGKV